MKIYDNYEELNISGLVEAGGETIKKMSQEIGNISSISEKAEYVLDTLLDVHSNNSDTALNTN